jgi:hypothetical protein
MGAIGQTVQGLTSVVGGMIGGRARRREARAAKAEYGQLKSDFQALDTSNLSANQQNSFEDVTVNTQAADFSARNQQQAYGNTLNQLNQSAGGSGIAALAQASLGIQTDNLAKTSAQIGAQENTNQINAAREASAIQTSTIAGANVARTLKADQTETMLGMSQQRVANAEAARAKATDQLVSGIGNVAAGALEGVASLGTGGLSKLAGA